MAPFVLKSLPYPFLLRYPRVFHVTLVPDPAALIHSGLRSASGLLDLFGLDGPERYAMERRQRKTAVRLEHLEHGSAFLNDQRPLPAKAMERCLRSMTSEEWYVELNERIFFWLSRNRLHPFASARFGAKLPRTLLTLNTRALCAGDESGNESRLELCAFNSGSAIRRAAPRDRSSLQSVHAFPLRHPGSRTTRTPVELSIVIRRLPIAHAVEAVEPLG